MKNLIFAIVLLLPLFAIAGNGNEIRQAENNKIEAYYFHFSARCVTCRTVEAEAKNDILTLYPQMVKDGEISFLSVNLEDKEGKALGEKLKISGQTLLIVKGNRKINLTNEGFLYAIPNPLKLKSIIKEKVDQLVNYKE